MTPRRETTTRMLGCADYEATWIGEGTAVRLIAHGFLPCTNHLAQLEKRAEVASPAVTELVFYTQESREETFTPFRLETIVLNSAGSDSLTVIDALGAHQILITSGNAEGREDDASSENDTEKYLVYCRPQGVSQPKEVCFMVPVGTRVLPLYREAFGPAGKRDCAAFIAADTHPFLEKLRDPMIGFTRTKYMDD